MIPNERAAPRDRSGPEKRQAGKPDYRKCTSARTHSQARWIDFAVVNAAALAALPSLAFRLVAGGTLRGNEYTVRNPTRADRTPGSFKINIRTGRWADFAVGARGGDIISLVAYLRGDGQIEGARVLAQMLGLPMRSEQRRARETQPIASGVERPRVSKPADDDSIRRALASFAEAVPLPGTPAETYLIKRIGTCIDWPADLRFHPKCGSYFGADHRWECHPALVALLRDIETNEPRAIHRTFLKPDGTDRLRDEWGCRDEGKKALGPIRGCVLKLSPDDAVTGGLYLAEGIETALSLLARGFRPIWATLGTSGMREFPILSGIEALTILGDNDTNGAGIQAARKCGARWRAAGREVANWTPRITDTDWNDVLRSMP